jgi:hypothetical protein
VRFGTDGAKFELVREPNTVVREIQVIPEPCGWCAEEAVVIG